MSAWEYLCKRDKQWNIKTEFFGVVCLDVPPFSINGKGDTGPGNNDMYKDFHTISLFQHRVFGH